MKGLFFMFGMFWIGFAIVFAVIGFNPPMLMATVATAVIAIIGGVAVGLDAAEKTETGQRIARFFGQDVKGLFRREK